MNTLTPEARPRRRARSITTVESVRAYKPTPEGFALWFWDSARPWLRKDRFTCGIPFSELDELNLRGFTRYTTGSNKLAQLWHAVCSNPQDLKAIGELEAQVWTFIRNEAISEHRGRRRRANLIKAVERVRQEDAQLEDWIEVPGVPSRIENLPDGELKLLVKSVAAVAQTPPFDTTTNPLDMFAVPLDPDDPCANCRGFLHEMIGLMDHWFQDAGAVRRALPMLFVLRGAAPRQHGPGRENLEAGEDAPVRWDRAQPFLSGFEFGDVALVAFEEYLRSGKGRPKTEFWPVLEQFKEGLLPAEVGERQKPGETPDKQRTWVYTKQQTLRRNLRKWMGME